MERPGLDSRRHLGNALTTARIRCFSALLAGLLFAASSASAATLWVANADSRTLVEFPGELKSSKARILNDSNDLDGASTIAFYGGNLSG